jgi:hypothetical protein
LGADGSAGLKGFGQVPVLKSFDQVAVPAFMVLLGEGKQDHENKSAMVHPAAIFFIMAGHST